MRDFFLGTDFRPSNMIELLRWRAEHQPNREAYVWLSDEDLDSRNIEAKTISMNYSEIERQARAVGGWLQSIGIVGQRVVLLYPTGFDSIIAAFGCLFSKNIAVPVYPPQTVKGVSNLQAIIKDAQATLILTTSSFREKLAPLLASAPALESIQWLDTEKLTEGSSNEWRQPDVRSDNLAFLQYTSGTTGSPKGVMLTHSNLLNNFRLITCNYEFTSDTRCLTWVPTHHTMGLCNAGLQPVYGGYVSLLMSPLSFLQSPARWVKAFSDYEITASGGPNFAYDLCVRHATPELIETLDLSKMRALSTGAEYISRETLNRFAETFEPCGFRRETFVAAYGLTEATLIVSISFDFITKVFLKSELENNRAVEATGESENTKSLVSCGRILPEQRVVIVKPETMKQCSPQEIGEIWVSGPSISQGYWNRPVETETLFRARLKDTGEGPFLRTGDLGLLYGDQLFVTGRLKDMIIIRGRNHYPQDIESLVEKCHPAIQQGRGAAFAIEVEEEERLVVVQEVVQNDSLDFDAVIKSIRQTIAQEHGIEVYAVLLAKEGSIPRTASNKIQRHACRAEYLAGTLQYLRYWRNDSVSDNFTPEEFQIECLDSIDEQQGWLAAFCAFWMGVNAEQIDKTQAITQFGLDSLRATELTHNIQKTFNVSLPMWKLLQGPSIAQISEQITAARKQTSASPQPAIASTGARIDEYRLSRNQQSLWFLHRIAPDSPAYNIAGAARIYDDLNVPALRQAYQTLIDRHASLRTNFFSVNGEPFQRVHPRKPLFFVEEDATGWSEEVLKKRLVELAVLPFDLENGSLQHFYLFKRSEREHILLTVIHHIITDFWSEAVLASELKVIYAALTRGVEPRLAPVGMEYVDFVRWQEEMINSAEGERLWAYWSNQLAGELPALDLSTNRPRPPAQTFRGASHYFRVDAEITKKLRDLSRKTGATLYMTLLAAFQALLYRYTNQEDILVGSLTAGRSRAEMTNVVGYFINPLVLRANFYDDLPFEAFLSNVRQTALDAFNHQDYPFSLLVERLQPERDPSRSPLFQVLFVFQKPPVLSEEGFASFALREGGAQIQLGGLAMESLALEQRIAQFDMTLMMAEVDERLDASLEYNTDLFDARMTERFANHLRSILSAIAADASQSIATLPLLTNAEQKQLLIEWNRTEARYDENACLHQLFEAQAERAPEAVAVSDSYRRLTYAELNARANHLAHRLQALGVGPEQPVGLCANRDADMIVGLLGILKSGGAYVPLDPAYPQERLAFMINDAKVKVLLTERSALDDALQHEARVLYLDDEMQSFTTQSAHNPVSNVVASNLAYIIYTSGSMGIPKGVAIEHHSANALCNWSRTVFDDEELSGVLVSTSICFDVSVFEIFAPLSWGGRIILAQNVLQLSDLLDATEISLISTVPSAMIELLRIGGVPDSVRTVNLAGEPLSSSLAQQIYEQTNARRVLNIYGPSEDTTYSTYDFIPRGSTESPAIGRPISNTKAYLLNRYLQPVPIGVAGQLYLEGAGLARGYLGHPDLTAERFTPSSFSTEPGARLYATGDLARYRTDGEIEFLGRIDHQVKVRGYRIELGEIEAVLAQHPGVSSSIVVVLEDKTGDKRIVAYVTRAQNLLTSTDDLYNFLRQKLPAYMIPSAFVVLDSLPLTPNGKVNRKALPVPDRLRPELDTEFIAPANVTQETFASIWSELLKIERVGISDNFFRLGGHSLMATRLISRIRSAFQVELPLQAVFENPTVAGLSERVDAIRWAVESLEESSAAERGGRVSGEL